MLAPWKKSYDKPRWHIKKQRYHFANKVRIVKATVFPVVVDGCESWTIKNEESQRIDAFKLWFWRRLLRVPWIAKRSNQSFVKEINPEYSMGLSCSSDSKESACNAGDLGSIPLSGRFPGEGNGNMLQYSSLEKSMDRGVRWAIVHGTAKNEQLTHSFEGLMLKLELQYFGHLIQRANSLGKTDAFPMRLSHRAIPLAIMVWVDPRRESRTSAEKTGTSFPTVGYLSSKI